MDGDLQLGGEPVQEAENPPEERANIFVLYEQNIGLLQPLIVEELKEAEKLYPMTGSKTPSRSRSRTTFGAGVTSGPFWSAGATEGKSDEEPGRDYQEDGRSYLKGKYAGYVKH